MPYGARARAERLLGTAHDRLGHHDLAFRAYAAALADAPKDDALHTRKQVRAERQTIDPRAAESYRLSLEGVARVPARREGRCATPCSRHWSSHLIDHGRALSLRAAPRTHAAMPPRERDASKRSSRARPLAPPIVLASAFVDYARLLEHDGDRARALAMYRVRDSMSSAAIRARTTKRRARSKRLAGSSPHRNFLTFDRVLCLTAAIFSSIIYIWYEGGQLRPSLVRFDRSTRLDHIGLTLRTDTAGGCREAQIAGIG